MDRQRFDQFPSQRNRNFVYVSKETYDSKGRRKGRYSVYVFFFLVQIDRCTTTIREILGLNRKEFTFFYKMDKEKSVNSGCT